MNPKILNRATNAFIFLAMVIAVILILYYGKNSIITIHDNLDGGLPWAKMLKDNGMLFAIDTPTNSVANISTAYFPAYTYNLTGILLFIFDVFPASMIDYCLKILLGYGSMLLLLKRLFSDGADKPVIKLVSLGFAFVPTYPLAYLASVPLLCYCFIRIVDKASIRKDWRPLLLVLLPFISDFAFSGIFLLAFWLLGTIVLWVREKKINTNLIIGWLSLATGYIVCNLKLFYMLLFLDAPLNRTLSVNAPHDSLRNGLIDAAVYFIDGGYHAPSLARVILISGGSLLLGFFIAALSKKINIKEYPDQLRYMLVSIGLLCTAGVFSLMGGIYSTALGDVINSIPIPFLDVFNWGRFWFLNRIILYIWFAYTLVILSKIKKIRFMAYIIAIVQVIAIITSPVHYNYTAHNLNHDKLLNINEWGKEGITYNEFFAEPLFERIKKDINYNGEGAAAVGFHPGVLIYNGFSCLDGYLSSFPLARALAFREIIAPQLEYNAEDKQYYDSWAGRMYLYCDDAPYLPTRDRIGTPITLRINPQAFKELGGEYILSRGLIGNADELGLSLIQSYTDQKFIYDIYVYRAE